MRPLKSAQLKIECGQGEICPELEFVLSYIFEDRLGLGEVVLLAKDDRSTYSLTFGESVHLNIPSASFFKDISSNELQSIKPEVTGTGAQARLFSQASSEQAECSFDFDLFAAVFYVLTRIEELDFTSADGHGRFLTTNSWMQAADCLEIPIVDVWIQQLKEVLRDHGISVKEEPYTWWNTIDIDQIYASRGKPTYLRFAQVARSLLQAKVREAGVLLSTFFSSSDPYDMMSQMHVYGARNICFLLLNDDSIYDPPYNKNKESVFDFVEEYKGSFEMGLHPSYDSSKKLKTLTTEVRMGREWIDEELDLSRQHYLRLQWPETMEQLADLGVRFDYSMGFPDAPGFRAGTSRPFPFFDLRKRSKTQLSIVPFSVMDVTLRYYLKLSPKEAIAHIMSLIENIKKYDGMFVSLWHNESYSEINGWKPWKEVFDQMKIMALK